MSARRRLMRQEIRDRGKDIKAERSCELEAVQQRAKTFADELRELIAKHKPVSCDAPSQSTPLADMRRMIECFKGDQMGLDDGRRYLVYRDKSGQLRGIIVHANGECFDAESGEKVKVQGVSPLPEESGDQPGAADSGGDSEH